MADNRPLPNGPDSLKTKVEKVSQKKPAIGSQNTPGVIQMAQIMANSGPLTQDKVEGILDRLDPEDVIQYLVTRNQLAVKR